VVLGFGVGDSIGQVPIADAFDRDRCLTGSAGESNRVGCEVEEDFVGRRVVLGMQRARRAAMSPRSSPWDKPPRAISITASRSSSVGMWRAAIASTLRVARHGSSCPRAAAAGQWHFDDALAGERMSVLGRGVSDIHDGHFRRMRGAGCCAATARLLAIASTSGAWNRRFTQGSHSPTRASEGVLVHERCAKTERFRLDHGAVEPVGTVRSRRAASTHAV
jgi:hypothetical protein